MPNRQEMNGTLDELLSDNSQQQGAEAWLISYLDVLTLLITLFVLLLALTERGNGQEHNSSATAAISQQTRQQDVLPLHDGLLPQHEGLLPQYDGLQQSFKALALEGVEASQGNEGMTLRIADNLLFASGRAELTPEGEAVIRKLLVVLNSFEGDISVEGHTDNIPIHTRRFASNWELSTGRAISVLRFLEQEKIAHARLRAIGYADTRPLASNITTEGRAANRRVELVLREP
ncbi:OmpA/MotB family protein [Zobellella aerophila]|uniref:OmpA family protein n=1 Tax=Zobellella aerophila TaxID=870480 RepID=A0ABP6VRD6_9GAMM